MMSEHIDNEGTSSRIDVKGKVTFVDPSVLQVE